MRAAILTTHPIQYQSPWFRGLAREIDLHVYFAHRQTAAQQGAAGYGVDFDWDVDLLSGYAHTFLHNVAAQPDVNRFAGCDTPEIYRILRSERIDALILTGWSNKSFLQAGLACKRLGIPLLVRGDSHLHTPRSWLKRTGKRIVYPAFLRAFDACLWVGQRNLAYYRAYGVPEAKLFRVPHFVDVQWFAARAAEARTRRAELREQMQLAPDDVAALFVGRFVEFKRPTDLLRAAAQLTARRVRPIFAGAGPLEARIRAQSDSLGVGARLLGFRNQSELPAVYAAVDLLVLPSDARETWGLVVNEAMACGIPAVVADSVGCAPDLITPGATGYAYPNADIPGMVAAIDALLPKLGSRQVSDALASKAAEFSCEAAVEATLRALRHVVSPQRVRGVS